MKLYGAIDLHSNNNVTVVINEHDQVVYQKRLPNDLSLIAQELPTYRRSLQGIVVESTYNWYWLVDGLMGKGHRLHLANTAAIQQYNGLKYTDDHNRLFFFCLSFCPFLTPSIEASSPSTNMATSSLSGIRSAKSGRNDQTQ
jgi:hypothetical protein